VLRRHLLLTCACAAFVAAATLWTHATAVSGPAFWTIGTTADLLKGTSDGVLIDRNGTISAGPRLANRLTSTPAQIWSLAAGSDGTFWAGTGGDGRIIRLRAGQPEETAYDAEENNVFAIVTAGTRVYAATGPDGKVYVLDGTAPARVFFDPTEKYIWALAVDSANRLWVGAGNPAVLYRVNPDGTNQVVYRPPAAHVVALTADSSGRMLAGTDSPGRLYRFDAADRPSVLLDPGQAEVRAIVNGPNGAIYAAAVSKGDEPSPAGEVSSIAVALGPPPQPANAPAASSTSSASSGRRSVIFRIDQAGPWESFWESQDLIYDIAVQSDGSLLVATGPEGRLYTVQGDRQVSLYTGVDAQQITRLLAAPGSGASAMATANPGRVIAIGPANQTPATYVAPVRDTKSASSWGTIRWESAGPVRLFTRSGNTDKPDETWSDWSNPYATKAGETIQSPPARFLQWKAVLTTEANQPPPQLTSVTAAYLTRNTRPAIASITIHSPGLVFQRPFSSDDSAIAGLDDATAEARRAPVADPANSPAAPALGKRMFQKGLQTIAWRGEDADGDRLSYSLSYRREGETAWQELKGGLLDPIFVWDTTTVADGRYLLRVVASDEPTNTPDRKQTGTRDSEPVDVDNTPPSVTTSITRPGSGVRLTVRVRDAYSPVQKVEYSLGGDVWRLVYPVDGLADSPDEQYEIPLATETDAARIVIRATDTMQNVASHAVTR
jgi:hypothetical protein